MRFKRWTPRKTPTGQEAMLLKRHRRTRKLFAFLRVHRRELFPDSFQAELEAMYRDTGAGKSALPPALLAMATLLQGYLGVSDADAVEATVTDLRWQMVLDCLGATRPAFSQGTLHDFRHRLIENGLDRRLLERTVELARETKDFDWKKVPKSLAIAIDSSPLEGAGRVEDTVNLLGHAARKLLECAAVMLDRTPESVARAAGIPLLTASSVKRGLDIDWSDAKAKAQTIDTLIHQVDGLEAWVREKLPDDVDAPPLRDHLETLEQLRNQDLEPDPSGGGTRIRDGVAEDRRISIEDGEMRHGRKSKSKRFDGYKRHVARCLDAPLILACAVTPANRPESEAAPKLADDLRNQGVRLGSLHVDRAYITSSLVEEVQAQKGEIVCKPWVARNGRLFAKGDFQIDVSASTITCPAGETESISLGIPVQFDADTCDDCRIRDACTSAKLGTGRQVSIAPNEALQQQLTKQLRTPSGREKVRRRVAVEHALAHISARQGNRARYLGVSMNEFDLRRAAAIQNLESIHRVITAKAA